ncbi:hypothetical protein BKA70DRAFT_551011 [Coprinopsis sp. MPI-PUGE-AT-0042]|nr:hypothetical protein BKA70DRAFT_551011 [Coprinopsis sp. MPI-PUGE-AT-0042]
MPNNRSSSSNGTLTPDNRLSFIETVQYQASDPEYASLPLPRGWNRYTHPNGDVYYRNNQLRVCTMDDIRRPEILRYVLDAREDHLERCSDDPNFRNLPQDLEITITDANESTAIIGMYSVQAQQAYEWNERQGRVTVLPKQHYWANIAEYPSHRPFLPRGAEQEFAIAVQQAKLRLRSGARFPFTEGQLDQIWARYERLRARSNTPGLGWLIGVVMPLESVSSRMNGDFEAMMGELRV